MAKPPQRPKDANQLAHLVKGIATGEPNENQDVNRRAKSIVDLATMDDEDRKKLADSKKKN